MHIVIGIISVLLILWGIDQCTSCENESNRKERRNMESKVELAIEKGNFTDAREYAAKMTSNSNIYKDITQAQIAYLINSKNFKQAYSLSQEENVVYTYFELIMPQIIEIYESKGKSEVLKNLALVQFEHAPDLTRSVDNNNARYNAAITKYNSLLEQFIIYLKINNDKEFATKLLLFIKPILVNKSGNNGSELSDRPMRDIKNKLEL